MKITISNSKLQNQRRFFCNSISLMSYLHKFRWTSYYSYAKLIKCYIIKINVKNCIIYIQRAVLLQSSTLKALKKTIIYWVSSHQCILLNLNHSRIEEIYGQNHMRTCNLARPIVDLLIVVSLSLLGIKISFQSLKLCKLTVHAITRAHSGDNKSF